MQPPHLRDRVRLVWDFDLSGSLVRSAPLSYAASIRQTGDLPTPSFRFLLAMDALAVRLTKRVVDFHHQAIAHGGRTTKMKRGNKPRFMQLLFKNNFVQDVRKTACEPWLHGVLAAPQRRRAAP